MKLGIAAHCTIDSIILNDLQYDVAGGPACYGAFTAKNLKFDVDLYTKFGSDFPLIEQLGNFNIAKNQLLLSLIHISEPTRPRLISYEVFC